MDERETGTVKWFSNVKGYGFVDRDAGEGDVFVHYSSINADGYRSLNEGQRVEYTLTEGPKGFSAVDVQLAQPGDTQLADVEPVEIEPVEIEPVEIEPVEIEPVEIEPVQVEPVGIEPVQVEPVEIEPVQVEPVDAVAGWRD